MTKWKWAAAFLFVLVLTVLVAPLLIDVDSRVRPMIQNSIQSRLKVKAEVGALQLSLWRGLAVSLASLHIQDESSGRTLFRVGPSRIQLRLWSLFEGRPEAVFVADSPEFFLWKTEGGAWIFSDLMRAPVSATPTVEATPVPTETSRISFAIPLLSIEIKKGRFEIEGPETRQKIVLKEIGLKSSPLQKTEALRLEMSSEVELGGFPMTVKGPWVAEAEVGGQKILFGMDLSQTEISMSPHFLKPKGKGLKVHFQGRPQAPGLQIESLRIQPGDAEIQIAGPVGSEKIDLDVETLGLSLESLAEWVPSLSSFQMLGVVSAQAKITRDGPTAPIAVKGQLKAPILTAMRVPLRQVSVSYSWLNSKAEIPSWSAQLFDGSIGGDVRVDLASQTRGLSGRFRGKSINLEKLIELRAPVAKGSITGKGDLDFEFRSSGSNAEAFRKNLFAKGSFSAQEGSLSGLMALKAIGEKLKSIPGAQDKLSQVQVGDKYRDLSIRFELKDQRISLSDGKIHLEQARADATAWGEIRSDLGLTVQGDLFLPLNPVPRRLAVPDGRARIPYQLLGTAVSPAPNWDVTTKAVAGAYVEQEGVKALNQGLKNLKEQTKDPNIKKLLDQVPEDVGELLKNIKF